MRADQVPLCDVVIAPGGGLHGGPEAQGRLGFDQQHRAMAAGGITVFVPNIRGSSGSGREFLGADDRHGRRDAFADVLAAADRRRRPVDRAEPLGTGAR